MVAYSNGTWSDFAVAHVGASAALLGLVFVGLSINLRAVIREPQLVSRAAEAVVLLGTVLATSTAVLLPGQSRWALGTELIVLGCRHRVGGRAATWSSRRRREELYAPCNCPPTPYFRPRGASAHGPGGDQPRTPIGRRALLVGVSRRVGLPRSPGGGLGAFGRGIAVIAPCFFCGTVDRSSPQASADATVPERFLLKARRALSAGRLNRPWPPVAAGRPARRARHSRPPAWGRHPGNRAPRRCARCLDRPARARAREPRRTTRPRRSGR